MRLQGKMPDFDFAGFARMLGLEGIRVGGPAGFRARDEVPSAAWQTHQWQWPEPVVLISGRGRGR
jgi:hypothetical protein